MLKCPSCASSLRFDIAAQKLHCDYCSSSFDPKLFDSVTADAELQDDLEESKPGDTGLYETAVWVCPGCGAALTYADDTDVTSVCTYCGGRNIMFERIRGERRPESIVPFTVTKEDCIKNYTKRARKAFLSPGYLLNKAQTESFRGIYMPYFEYYADLDGDLSLSAESLKSSDSDKSVYEVYFLKGHVKGQIYGNSHDASVRFADDISESLGDFGERKRFTPGYLCGFYAETSDAGPDTYQPSREIFTQKIAEAVVRKAEKKPLTLKEEPIDLGTIDSESIVADAHNISAKRTLYPVWFMSHRMRNGRLTYAAVNGSTGKVAADFPLSFFRVLLFALGTGLLYFLLFNLVGAMPRPVPALGISTVLFFFGSFLNAFVLERKLKRLLPDHDSSKRFNARLIPGFVLAILLVILLFGSDENSKWGACFLIGIWCVLAVSIMSMVTERKMIKRIDMEAMRLTHRDIRFAKRVATINMVLTLTVNFASFILMISDPLNEVYYYAAVVNAVLFMVMFFFTVRVNNYFSYRRPLQFNKKGGDDSAS